MWQNTVYRFLRSKVTHNYNVFKPIDVTIAFANSHKYVCKCSTMKQLHICFIHSTLKQPHLTGRQEVRACIINVSIMESEIFIYTMDFRGKWKLQFLFPCFWFVGSLLYGLYHNLISYASERSIPPCGTVFCFQIHRYQNYKCF